MRVSEKNRESWNSGFGFIMSAAGSAVGLGNIWKFPYVCGTNGGAVFLIIYIVFAFVLGYPILLTELAVGRSGQMNAVDSCRKIHPKWGFAGGFGIIGAFAVLSYYSVVGGWVMKYAFSFIFGDIPDSDYFTNYSASVTEPLLWQLGFILITAAIVYMGISGGIEKVSSVLIPFLLIFLIGMMIYSLSLPDAPKGVSFFLIPESGQINSIKDILDISVRAMGQVFFSLSLGMGTLITYGSYLHKDFDLGKGTAYIVIIDTAIAVISGLVILPAVFSLGLSPDEGEGLIFMTLTEVFGSIKGGKLLGALFFLLVFFAAITSSISLMQVIVTFVSEKTNIPRCFCVLIPAATIYTLSIPASLSMGIMSDAKLFGMDTFDLYVFFSDNIIMPLGGLFLCILAGYIMNRHELITEISSDGKYRFRLSGLYTMLIRYICPILIIITAAAFFS